MLSNCCYTLVPEQLHSFDKQWTPKDVKYEDLVSDPEMLDLLASLKYIRVNYNHMSAEKALYEALSSSLSSTLWQQN